MKINLDKIKALSQSLEERQRQFQKDMQIAFHEGCKEIFEAYQDLQSFSFKGYTQYFNDGDTCDYYLRTEPEYDIELNGVYFDDVEGANPVLSEARFEEIAKTIHNFLEEIGSDFFEMAFQDHAKFIVTRGGVEIEDYSDHE